MDIYVLNRSFDIVGVCDDYKSCIWTTRYFTPGDFELYLPATDDNILLLKEDRYVVRDKDITADTYKNVMIVEKVQITTSVEDGNFLTVTGRCLKSILSRRIVWRQTVLSGRLETAIRQVVAANAINADLPERNVERLYLGQIKGFTDTVDKQATGDNLAEFVAEITATYGVGWDVYVKDGTMYFDLYKGTDRSYGQAAVPYVTFSQDYDNLLTTDYQYDKTNYKNVALVGGEGEGLDRRTVAVGNASGLDRYEVFIDSRNASSNDGTVTDAEYNALLEEEGRETLKSNEFIIREDIAGEVEPAGNYILGVHYFLGDIVEVINEYGIETTPRIVEIIESEDDTGSVTIPTFSTWEV